MDFSPSEELDLSKYMSAEKLSAMAPMEQTCYANTIENYKMLQYLGKYFMLLRTFY